MTYDFEIVPDDYVAMSWEVGGGWRVLYRDSLSRAVVFAVLLGCQWVLAQPILTGRALAFTAGVPLFYTLVTPLWWRWRWLRQARRAYEAPPYSRMFGHHRLTFSDDGIHSIGPVHDTFRRWPAITGIRITETHVLLSTVFGNVYTIPRLAVHDLEKLREYIETHLCSPESGGG